MLETISRVFDKMLVGVKFGTNVSVQSPLLTSIFVWYRSNTITL